MVESVNVGDNSVIFRKMLALGILKERKCFKTGFSLGISCNDMFMAWQFSAPKAKVS